MKSALTMSVLTFSLCALAACHSDEDRARAARVPDATRAPPPLPEDAPTPGTQAAEAAGEPASAAR